MKKIVAFGASTSSISINQQLAGYASRQLQDVEVNLLDLNDFAMPIFDVDRQNNFGIPQKAHDFKKHLQESDGILISFAEHNGSYSTAFKNIFDWASRVEKDMWLGKPMMLLATSPGKRGGQNVLALAMKHFPFRGAQVIASFSLPSFGQNFDSTMGIIEADLKMEFEKQLGLFQDVLNL
ncbi:MAG: NAD(P)H-dependent oxidoreductase [Cytophagales bacterium]|nr:NAD(P)H-dependent oxidoreductase [Cytophagales bacterium]